MKSGSLEILLRNTSLFGFFITFLKSGLPEILLHFSQKWITGDFAPLFSKVEKSGKKWI
jgi:hypothetical protein